MNPSPLIVTLRGTGFLKQLEKSVVFSDRASGEPNNNKILETKNINYNYILVDGMNGSATKNRKCMDENNNKESQFFIQKRTEEYKYSG